MNLSDFVFYNSSNSLNLKIHKYDVFISYSRADYKDENNVPIPNNVISKILSAFKKNNISYWIDESGIYTGDITISQNSQSIFCFYPECFVPSLFVYIEFLEDLPLLKISHL